MIEPIDILATAWIVGSIIDWFMNRGLDNTIQGKQLFYYTDDQIHRVDTQDSPPPQS